MPSLRRVDGPDAPAGDLARLAEFFQRHERVLVVSGAGCSTRSGIPAYRDASGQWLRRDPVLFQDFISRPEMRRRYWARSFFGWQVMTTARPNDAHRALARLEAMQRLSLLVTQNVDGLHARAGHRDLVELHGSLAEVVCLDCGHRLARTRLQASLSEANPDWHPKVLGYNPDGDAELDAGAYPGFSVIDCPVCGGMLKPDVVFFGESVPAGRVETVTAALDASDAVLVVGSSLVVWSGYRLAREAAARGLGLAAINRGRTRADALLDFKVDGDCDRVLGALVEAIDTTLPD